MIPMAPVFVVGCPRSGTTLLAVLLDRHTELAMTPETAFYNEIAPAVDFGNPATTHRVLSSWSRLPELGLTPDDVLSAIPGNATAGNILGTILYLYSKRRGKSHYGEKTPQHLWHVDRIFADFPDARIICIARDGRDVALSLAEMPWWSNGLSGAADLWRHSEQLRAELREAYPEQFLSIAFADLVRAPEATLIQVMAFLQLQFQSSQLNPCQGSGVVLDRSLQWKGKALQAVNQNEVGRQSSSAPSHVLAELDALL